MLSGYQLRFNKKSNVDGSGKCSINSSDGVVYLAIFEISSNEKPTLDKCEGLGKGYNQAVVRSEEYGDCLTYIADSTAIDEKIFPMDWYKEMVLLGCRLNRFPKDYISSIEKTGSIQDPRQERSRANWRIVEELCTDT